MENKKTIKVAIADDHVVVRKALVGLIHSFDDYLVTLQAKDGIDLLEQLKDSKELPDICILDISMPRLNGYETGIELKSKFPEIKILGLSVLDSDFSIDKMIKSGARGFLNKNIDPDELQKALQVISAGGFYHKTIIGDVAEITSREQEFLQYCSTDLAYKEIADRMAVSINTIHSFRRSLFQKLKMKNRSSLVLYAIQAGIVGINSNGCE